MISKTLLLVEDSFTIQKVVETTFTAAGFQVVVANEAQAGLDQLTSVSPDIVLADASMPEMDGFQLCQAIRDTAGFEHVPVLLLTSRFTSYDDTHGQRVGVTGYLAKPFDSYTLLALGQQLISRTSTSPGADVRPADVFSPERAADDALGLAPTADARPDEPAAPSSAAAIEPANIPPGYQTLSANLAHIVQETIQSHLATLLDALTPHLVEEVRTLVSAKMPELLEALLQQEIEKLKHAVAQESQGDAPAPGAASHPD